MRLVRAFIAILLCALGLLIAGGVAQAQTGNSTPVSGTVTDPTGAVIANANISIHNPVSGYDRTTTTDSSGNFNFPNVPFNPYHVAVNAAGFAPYAEDIEVRSNVPLVLMKINLQLAGTASTVTVEAGGDLVETDPNFHTDIDRSLFDKVPLESASSSVSSLVTLSSPGVVADSNGLFHGLGDHAENSFSVDGQPITDQQSKVFSNQIPVDSIQSMQVIAGAPPAEFGDKTSLVIQVTTRSGLGVTQPTGSVTASYGSFGSANTGFNLATGGQKWGNFISANGLNTGRFLDPPEFQTLHAKGNEENVFDRLDFKLSDADTLQFNFNYTRSWFQEPNSFDSIAQDQRAQIRTFNVAPTWTHVIGSNAVFTFGGFVRQDRFNYYPSGNPLADLLETLSQQRRLTNAGLRSDISYVKGIHNIKAGATFQHTFLTENFSLGLTDPGVNSPCIQAVTLGNATVGTWTDFVPDTNTSLTDPSQCAGAGDEPNIAANPDSSAPFVPGLACFDFTRPVPSANDGCPLQRSGLFNFHGTGDIRELALYLQDTVTKGSWTFNLGIRGDIYRGLTRNVQPQPRVGIAYNLKKTSTVLRVSYARVMETPFNENLVLASSQSPAVDAIFGGTSGPIPPGQRNEFHAGFEQAFGKYFVVDADYLWKYTRNGYDFSDLLNTPVFFPIAWHNSKISGPSARVSIPNIHGLTAYVVLSSPSARFFDPQVGGLGISPGTAIFRIDHDEKFEQTTHLQYQPWKNGPWFGFNWRYDSGLVAGPAPCAGSNTNCAGAVETSNGTQVVDLTGFSADQQLQAGLFCGSTLPTLSSPLLFCPASQYGSTRIQIPAPGTEDDDRNPPRIAPRNLFDISVGVDNLFHGDKYKWSARITVINLTNSMALYNFLSTFSGTHFVTSRSETVELGFHF
jgi:Carboxypeptidase regulatory-like domain